jgi:proteasome lid subunit RPN8/RPN11
VRIPPELIRHLEACYPEEGCGLLLRAPDGSLRARPMANAYERYRALDPATYPRTARTAYLFDSREQLQVWEEAERRGEAVSCIVHSHADAGAYFSAEDRAMAAPDGEPLYPEVSYLVVAVDGGRATAARLYRWEHGDFSESAVPLPGSDP